MVGPRRCADRALVTWRAVVEVGGKGDSSDDDSEGDGHFPGRVVDFPCDCWADSDEHTDEPHTEEDDQRRGPQETPELRVDLYGLGHFIGGLNAPAFRATGCALLQES